MLSSSLIYQPECYSDSRFEVFDLECVRGFHSLFNHLNFKVESGTAIQIVGANGSGKTTLLRTICGLSLAETGDVHWNGVSIRNCAAEFRANLSYLGHKSGLKPDLTPIENIQALERLNSGGGNRNISDALDWFGIGRGQNRPCRQLSAGQNQRIGLARVVISGSPVWILDEPVTSLDTNGIDLVTNAMQSHLERSGMIVFTSHQPLSLSDGRLRILSLDSETSESSHD